MRQKKASDEEKGKKKKLQATKKIAVFQFPL